MLGYNFKHLRVFKNLGLVFQQRYMNTNASIAKPYKVLFFGSDEYALTCLKHLKSHMDSNCEQNIVKKLEVVCLPTSKLPVREFAEKFQLPLYIWPDLPKPNTFDVAVVVSFGKLIPSSVIKSFPMGMLNIHASHLPDLRGAAPITRCIELGRRITGVTIMKIAPKKFDHGLVLNKSDDIAISSDVTTEDLSKVLAEVGADLCMKTLNDLPLKLLTAKAQNNNEATYAPKITSEDTWLDFQLLTSTQIWNKYRAYGYLKAFHLRCVYNGDLLKLTHLEPCTEMHLASMANYKDPGLVRYHKPTKKLLIACNSGCIACTKLAIQKKTVTASDFYNGYMQVRQKRGEIIVFEHDKK